MGWFEKGVTARKDKGFPRGFVRTRRVAECSVTECQAPGCGKPVSQEQAMCSPRLYCDRKCRARAARQRAKAAGS